MAVDTLLGDADEPAVLDGGLPIPAPTARDLALQPGAPRWLRRLYRHPSTGDLITMDSRRRFFTNSQRKFIALRDQTCRTPWCEAPIRHTDHIRPAEHGGKTSITNGQGLCVACNIAKQAPGWKARPGPGGRIDLITPPATTTAAGRQDRPAQTDDSRRSNGNSSSSCAATPPDQRNAG
jgi:hypothetical protein